jgi:hypothetical protein
MLDRPDRIVARLKPLAFLIAGLLLAWVGVDLALYRSGLYYRLAAPLSHTGAVVNALMLLEREYEPGSRTILVLGDSRIGEGFSAPRAEAADASTNFINLAVPGSTPRTWYYLLREIVRRGYRFDAVLIGTIYQPRTRELLADWPLDPLHQAPLLGLQDLRDYPAGFVAADMRARARDAILLPALAMRQDTMALLAAPLQRRRDVRKFRPRLLASIDNYVGSGETMPALEFDGSGNVVDWRHAKEAQRAVVEGHLADLATALDAPTAQSNRDYAHRWLSAIDGLLASRDAQLIVFPLPRGPYGARQPMIRDDADVPTALGVRRTATVLPADLLLDLERPEYFFDALHLNAAGRERMSTQLGTEVARVLEAKSR